MQENTRREFLKILNDAKPAAAPKAAAATAGDAPKAFVSATEGCVKLLLLQAGEPAKKDLEKLATLDAEWLAAFVDCCKGYCHNSAVWEHKRWRADFRDGKRKEVPPEKSELIRQYSERRNLLKARAIQIAEIANEICAKVYERSLTHLPALRARIQAEEEIMFAGIAELGRSPLLRMIDDLPRIVNAHIHHLRIKGANRRPGHILPKV